MVVGSSHVAVIYFLYICFFHYVFIIVTSLDYPETSPEINRNRGVSPLEPDVVSIIQNVFVFVCFCGAEGWMQLSVKKVIHVSPIIFQEGLILWQIFPKNL